MPARKYLLLMIRCCPGSKKQKEADDAYSNAMTKGTDLMMQKEYAKACESFRQALTIRQGDLNASNKLKEAESIIARNRKG